MLVEDRADQGVSLAQWLGTMREKVGAPYLKLSVTLANDRSLNDR